MYQSDSWLLRYLGHDGYQLTVGKIIIYIDPYKVETGAKADYILISHEHFDHFDKESIQRLRGADTVIIASQSVTSQLDGTTITLLPGQQHKTSTLNVLAVNAYNIGKQFHPKDDEKLGFILEIDDQRLYHAGDTDLIPEMGDLGQIDIALLPVSGTYVMTIEEAVDAVKLIRPIVAIPMHYGSIIGTIDDAKRFEEKASAFTNVVILEVEKAV